MLNTITPHLTALLIAHALAIVALDHLADGRPLDAEAGRPLRPYVVEEAQLHGVGIRRRYLALPEQIGAVQVPQINDVPAAQAPCHISEFVIIIWQVFFFLLEVFLDLFESNGSTNIK